MRLSRARLVRSAESQGSNVHFTALGALLAVELSCSGALAIARGCSAFHRAFWSARARADGAGGSQPPVSPAAGAAAGNAAVMSSGSSAASETSGLEVGGVKALAEGGGSRGKCVLCMGPRHVTSATACGHLFCWQCIIGWCQASGPTAECPLCRQPVKPQEVLRLPWH